MIRSMTAFASGERTTPWGTLGCELRSVNHRFLELGVRLPDELRVLEPALRERVAGRVARGKIDMDPDGKPAWMPGVILDITQQKLAEEARQRTEFQFRTIAEHFECCFCRDADRLHDCNFFRL